MDEDVVPDEKVFYIGSDNCDGYTSEEHSSPYSGAGLDYSEEPASNVVLKQLHALRVTQMKQGVDLSGVTRTQWGLSNLKFCHHIILKKSSLNDIPLIFQVTVCASCCPSEEHAPLFLGVYGDQESALLVNDVHEILNGRCNKLAVLRREDAMFFHHLTARVFDESEGVLLPPEPVLSVLEKIRINSSKTVLNAADYDEKKRKRASSIDILIESSLYLSMNARESLPQSDEEGVILAVDVGDVKWRGTSDDKHVENDPLLYSNSSNYQNHAPFSIQTYPSLRSHSPTASDESLTATSTESRSLTISDSDADADSSVVEGEREGEDSMSVMATAATAAHKALTEAQCLPPHRSRSGDNLRQAMSNQHSFSFSTTATSTSSHLDTHTDIEPECLPRTRRSNRPRASTFSVSSTYSYSTSQSLFDTEAERTPLGMITWLASLEDDDFVAAKMLAEFGNKDGIDLDDNYGLRSESGLDSVYEREYKSGSSSEDIPKYRGTRSKDLIISAFASREIRQSTDSMEPPTQRRRRANSVIEVTRQINNGSGLSDEGNTDRGNSGRIPRTYRKDPNWAVEGRSRGYVGAYSPAERRRRIERFLEKRRLRVWQKNVKYDVRKNFADSRIRVKGRFVKKEDQLAIQALGITVLPKDRNSDCDSEAEKSSGTSSCSSSDVKHVHIDTIGEDGKNKSESQSLGGEEHRATRNLSVQGPSSSSSVLGRSRTRADSDMQKREKGRAGTDTSST